MKKYFSKFFSILCFFTISLISFSSSLKEGEYYTLNILHTNDIHGNVEELPKYSTLIKQVRDSVKNLLVLEGGDIFARGEFKIFNGIPEMKMINEMGYDAWVIGNNDFRIPINGVIPKNDQTINNLIKLSKQPTLCANVIYKDNGKLLEGVKPYIIKKVNGIKIGIIGLTSLKPQDRGYEPDKVFLDAVEVLKSQLKELEGKTDINIVLSHCGLAVDTKLGNVPGIAAVIGADDHYHMTNPIYWVWNNEKGTPIVQHGGEEDHVLGNLELIFQETNDKLKLIDFRGSEYDTQFTPEDKKVRKIINEYRDKLKNIPVIRISA